MFNGAKVFVSGGAGVIGTALVDRLIAAGAIVLVGDLKPRPRQWPDAVMYRQGDLNEMTFGELSDFAPQFFFHLAATFERSTETYEFWQENDRHNTRLSHHLMDLLKDIPSLRKVVFASSYLIYDPDLYQFDAPADKPVSLRESDPVRPRNLCGMAKLQHEMELKFVSEFNPGLQTVCARIYRVYGRNSRDIVSRWIQALLKGETLKVFRKEGMFDYIYADDVAEGLYRLAEADQSGIVNLGNGRARRVEELIGLLRSHFPGLQAVDEASDIPYEASQADLSRLREWTGWVPERQLEDTIPELIRHYAGLQAETPSPLAPMGVLISSVSKKVPLIQCVREAAARIGRAVTIVGADSNPNCIGRHFVDRFWEMPKLNELSVSELIAYCRQHGIRAIIPTRDGELAYYARHRAELRSAGIDVMVSSERTVDNCTDKLAFYAFGQANGLPVIPTDTDLSGIDARRFVVKERFGAGARAIAIDVSREEAVRHAAKLAEPIFQPFVPGSEISADTYVGSSGRCLGVVLRRRELVVDGESQITSTFRNDAIERLCADIAEKLGIYGHAVMQLIVDEEGRPHLIECNARFGGASRLSLAVGLDSFAWFMNEAEGGSPESNGFARSPVERQLIRYAEDLIR